MKILSSIKDVKKEINSREKVTWILMVTNVFNTTEKIAHKNKITESYDKSKKIVVEIIDFERLWKHYSKYKGKQHVTDEVNKLSKDTITGYLSPVSEYIDCVLYRDIEKQIEELNGVENVMGAMKRLFSFDTSDIWSEENIYMTYLYASIIKFYKDEYKINIVENTNSWRCGIRGEYYGKILNVFNIKFNNVDPEHKKGKHFKLDISNGKYEYLTENAQKKLDNLLEIVDNFYEKSSSKTSFKSNLRNELRKSGLDIDGVYFHIGKHVLIEIIIGFLKNDFEFETPYASTNYRCIMRSI